MGDDPRRERGSRSRRRAEGHAERQGSRRPGRGRRAWRRGGMGRHTAAPLPRARQRRVPPLGGGAAARPVRAHRVP